MGVIVCGSWVTLRLQFEGLSLRGGQCEGVCEGACVRGGFDVCGGCIVCGGYGMLESWFVGLTGYGSCSVRESCCLNEFFVACNKQFCWWFGLPICPSVGPSIGWLVHPSVGQSLITRSSRLMVLGLVFWRAISLFFSHNLLLENQNISDRASS